MSRDLVTVLHGDCLDVLATLPDNSVDSVVTDPPYSLSFMSAAWDTFGQGFQQWCQLWAVECLRVLKPGGHLLAFGGTRTYHRLACAIEDAGFEIRDSITWIYGSGFPKSLDLSKAIDRAAGVERRVVGPKTSPDGTPVTDRRPRNADREGWDRPWKNDPERYLAQQMVTAPATDAARQWQGWGTALKPASEPIVVARKPLAGTVAQNVQRYGTGALNVDGCRVAATGRRHIEADYKATENSAYEGRMDGSLMGGSRAAGTTDQGRWPANVVLSHAATEDGADACADGCVPGCPVAELDRQSGSRDAHGANTGPVARGRSAGFQGINGTTNEGASSAPDTYGDTGGASRFFPTFRYQAKASSAERVSYVKEGASKTILGGPMTARCRLCGKQPHNVGNSSCRCPEPDFQAEPRDVNRIAHPTVKPLELMRWLVRLVTPPGGTVLEPFAGSGTTAEAAMREGFRCIAIEREADYLPLIEARLSRRVPLAPNVVVPPPLAGQLGMFDDGVA